MLFVKPLEGNCIQSHQAMLFSSLDWSVLTSDEVASAVATCGQAMRQLKKLSTNFINPLPLVRALGDRDCPLEHFAMLDPPWVCTVQYVCRQD